MEWMVERANCGTPAVLPLTCQVDHKLTLLKLRLVRLSMDQKDALTVLLTGRGEANFASIIKRMVASQKLDFDLISLKPEVGPNGQQFASTMMFKQKFLEDLVYTYDQADEIRIYEDRVKQYVFFFWEVWCHHTYISLQCQGIPRLLWHIAPEFASGTWPSASKTA